MAARHTLPPQSPIIAHAASDIHNTQHSHGSPLHMHTSTNPPQMHNLPELLKFSEVDSSGSAEHHSHVARVSMDKHTSISPKRSLNLRRKKTLPNKPLPNRPLPNKPLPNRLMVTNDKSNRDRSQSHVLGTIAINQSHPHPQQHTQQIAFNSNYNINITPTRNKSHTMYEPPRNTRNNRRRIQHNHAPRNVMQLQTAQPIVQRSKTPEPRRSKPLTKRTVVTPTQNTNYNTQNNSFAKEVMIQRLDNQYNPSVPGPQQHMPYSQSVSSTDESHQKQPPPPAQRRGKPRKPQSKSYQTHTQTATDSLRIQSVPTPQQYNPH
eukprot:157152_1